MGFEILGDISDILKLSPKEKASVRLIGYVRFMGAVAGASAKGSLTFD